MGSAGGIRGNPSIRIDLRDQLRQLDREIEAALRARVLDRMTRIHLEDARVRVARALEP
jgi:hypothetical protein